MSDTGDDSYEQIDDGGEQYGSTLGEDIFFGAAAGAIIGIGAALVSGGDVTKGAITGAVMGGVGGAMMKEMSMSGSQYEPQETSNALPMGGLRTSPRTESGMDAGMGAGMNVGMGSRTNIGSTEKKPSGILDRATSWIEKNPSSASILAQTVGGVASGIAASRSADKELDYLKERDKRNINATKVSGLSNIELKTVLPQIDKFADTPRWVMPSMEMKNNGANNSKAK